MRSRDQQTRALDLIQQVKGSAARHRPQASTQACGTYPGTSQRRHDGEMAQEVDGSLGSMVLRAIGLLPRLLPS
eukprot:12933084-Prorocentrum_lima.AAC.1